MFQARIHGRGGQGVVTSAELLSTAAFLDGRYAQAFPSFGSERMGAPVVSFCRIDTEPIRRHDPVTEADTIVVLDPTLLHEVSIFSGLTDQAFVLINSERSVTELGLAELAGRLPSGRLVTCPATGIARRHTGRPLPNAVLLGGLAALTGCVRLDSVAAAIRERLSGTVGVSNEAAAREGAALVTENLRSHAGA